MQRRAARGPDARVETPKEHTGPAEGGGIRLGGNSSHTRKPIHACRVSPHWRGDEPPPAARRGGKGDGHESSRKGRGFLLGMLACAGCATTRGGDAPMAPAQSAVIVAVQPVSAERGPCRVTGPSQIVGWHAYVPAGLEARIDAGRVSIVFAHPRSSCSRRRRSTSLRAASCSRRAARAAPARASAATPRRRRRPLPRPSSGSTRTRRGPSSWSPGSTRTPTGTVFTPRP